jgi:hypothetical protein
MKPNANSGRPANIPLPPFAIAKTTARVVRHPRAKDTRVQGTEEGRAIPPDEETLLRLNAMAKQYPFCILHREKDNELL